MNNKFTTEISYERPTQRERHGGSVIIASDVGALIRALGFMALWLVLTVTLMAEPMMLNSKAAKEKREPIYFSHGVVQPTLPSLSPSLSPSQSPSPSELKSPTLPLQLELRRAPTSAEGKLSAKPDSTALPENPPARLSYAVLTLK